MQPKQNPQLYNQYQLVLKGPLVAAFYPRQTLTAEKASTVDTGYTTVVSALRGQEQLNSVQEQGGDRNRGHYLVAGCSLPSILECFINLTPGPR